MELTHHQHVIGFGRTKWTLSNNKAIEMPIPGIHQIYWKNTVYTYQLIDYQEDTEEFLFMILDYTKILHGFIGIQVDMIHQQHSKGREWYTRIREILSDPSNFLLNVAKPKDRPDHLASLVAHFVTRT